MKPHRHFNEAAVVATCVVEPWVDADTRKVTDSRAAKEGEQRSARVDSIGGAPNWVNNCPLEGLYHGNREGIPLLKWLAIA